MDQKTPIIMEQYVKLSRKMIVSINWSKVTLILYIAKVQNGKTLVKT